MPEEVCIPRLCGFGFSLFVATEFVISGKNSKYYCPHRYHSCRYTLASLCGLPSSSSMLLNLTVDRYTLVSLVLVVKSSVFLVRVVVKSSFPVYVMQACMRSRDIGPLILDLDTVWKFIGRFSKGMYTQHALSRWPAGWARTGRFGGKKKNCCSCWKSNRGLFSL